MNLSAILMDRETDGSTATALPAKRRKGGKARPLHYAEHAPADEMVYRQAEVFYLQKQIQAQTPMVIVLTDGERVEGCIEWYDRRALKLRGRARTLVYKSAIKYMYKLSEGGHQG